LTAPKICPILRQQKIRDCEQKQTDFFFSKSDKKNQQKNVVYEDLEKLLLYLQKIVLG
jgi:hypothetical protein